MTITDTEDGKLITLSKPFDTRGKFLNFFYALSFFAGGMFFIPLLFESYAVIGIILFGLAISGAFFWAAYRFLNKALESERILVNKQTFQIIRTGLPNFKDRSFDLAKISNFRLLGKPELSRHPLAGESIDYLGFQTEQAVINEMHGDDRIAFTYEGRTITFGENIWSWQFDEIENLLFEVTGKHLTNADEG